jgi:tetraacyldisaccharide 4'-kinase
LPRSMPWILCRPLLWILSLIWVTGGRLKRVAATARSLDTPVISVGGLAMGGVGKTPMALYLAEALPSRSYKAAVLTRGYRRRSRRDLCLAKGSDAQVEMTGDEAQLLLRTTDVGIGSDRWSVGKQMQEKFRPDVFLLDDGFQHAKLKRTVDMVLLDGIDPLAGDAPFPLGRLREPISAIDRADILVITRAGSRRFDGLLRRLPKVPVFLADVQICRWIPERPPVESIAAFCGLANPDTFFETLELSGASVVLEKTFPDHHRYTREELVALTREAILQGARTLVTTQKDFVNLPGEAAQWVAPLKLIHVEVRLRVRDESAFLAQLDLLLGTASRFNGGCARF